MQDGRLLSGRNEAVLCADPPGGSGPGPYLQDWQAVQACRELPASHGREPVALESGGGNGVAGYGGVRGYGPGAYGVAPVAVEDVNRPILVDADYDADVVVGCRSAEVPADDVAHLDAAEVVGMPAAA